MAKTVKPDGFSAEIEKVLKKYGDDVKGNLDEITKRLAKKGAKEVSSKASSTFNGGTYAQGWTSRFETRRVSAQGTIYNQRTPGLPHLLENGHANRGGGRTPGRPHIAPVEEELIRVFEEEVKAKL